MGGTFSSASGLFGGSGQVALQSRLASLIAQRAVLADAIANADTPGYQAVQAQAFAPLLQQAVRRALGVGGAGGGTAVPGPTPPLLPSPPTGPGLTPAAVLPLAAAAPPAAGTVGAVGLSPPGRVTPDGNGVSLTAAMVALARNDLGYQAVLRQLQLTYRNLSIAIDAGGA